MVYVVVTVGLAITVEPVVALNPVPGVHVYVEPPVAVKVAESPAQIVALFTTGTIEPPIVTVEVAVVVQPSAEAAVIVYTVVTVGLAITLDPVDELSVAEGVQE